MKKKIEKVYHYDVVFDPNDQGYTVTVPDLPGLVTEGSTFSEAREMVKDAIRCALESALKETGGIRRSRAGVQSLRRERVVVNI